jgi:hypothetical protein
MTVTLNKAPGEGLLNTLHGILVDGGHRCLISRRIVAWPKTRTSKRSSKKKRMKDFVKHLVLPLRSMLKVLHLTENCKKKRKRSVWKRLTSNVVQRKKPRGNEPELPNE